MELEHKQNERLNIIDISFGARADRYEGSATHTFFLANYLGKTNNLNLITNSSKTEQSRTNYYKNVSLKFFDYENTKNVFLILGFIISNNFLLLLHLFSFKNYQLVYERLSFFLFSGKLFASLKRIPLIYEVNGIPDEELFLLFKITNKFIKLLITNMFRFQLKSAEAVIVQTEELKNIITKKYSLKNVYVVPNGANQQSLNSIVNSDKLTIVFVGVLDNLHNLDKVLETIHELSTNFKLYVIGHGPKKDTYQKLYKKDERFIFTGQLPQTIVQEYLRKADICIASYSSEYILFKKYGFYLCPLKIFEYMSFGKPVIMYGQTNSLLKKFEKENAIIISESSKIFQEFLNKLITDKSLRKNMGEQAQKLSKAYTWENSAQQTERILHLIISGCHPENCGKEQE